MLSKATLRHLTNILNSSSQVVLRADFNVPMKDGTINDPKRIKATIPTIKQILKYNPKSLVILSHMGRPNGVPIPQLSLLPVAQQLQKLLGRSVTFLDDCIGDQIVNRVKSSNNQIFLCQNVRFHPQQQGKIKRKDGTKVKVDAQKIKLFRNQLSKLGQIFISDAFGTAHRAHSSVVGIAHKVRVAGLLMQKQLEYLGNFIQKPKGPVLAILGGAKVADKLPLVKHMLKFADQIIIGGAMKSPFLTQVFKKQLGDSLNIMPPNKCDLHDIIYLSQQTGKKIHFPYDYRVATIAQMKNPKNVRIYKQSQPIPKGSQLYDIGPEAEAQYDKIINKAGSIFWNGPVGVIQVPQFRVGSQSIVNSMIKATKNGATTIIGGGDSASLVTKLGVQKQISFVSTGGGATIQLFQGKQLPGIKILNQIQQIKNFQKFDYAKTAQSRLI